MHRRRFLGGLGVVVLSNSLRGTSTVSPEQAHTIIENARAAWLNGDAEAFVQLFSPLGKFSVPGQSWQGHSAIRDAFQKFKASYKVNTIDLRNVVLQGDHAFVEWYWEEQELESGNTSAAEDAIAIDFQGQNIHRWREYIDSESPKTN